MKFHMERKLENINWFSSDVMDQVLLTCDGDDDDLDVKSVVSVILDAGRRGTPIETKFDDPLSAMVYFRDQKASWVMKGYQEVAQFKTKEELNKIRSERLWPVGGGTGTSGGSGVVVGITTDNTRVKMYGGGGGGGSGNYIDGITVYGSGGGGYAPSNIQYSNTTQTVGNNSNSWQLQTMP
jgi:hypothetical protein